MKKKCIALILLFLTASITSSIALGQNVLKPQVAKADQMKEFNAAFAHTVYFWLVNPESEVDREKFLASLKKFLNNSKYAKTCFIGTPPKATRDVVDGSFTYSLILTFESAEAQAKYQEEEAHLKFVSESKDLWRKVIVYDSIEIKK
jgi:hypothetical protein